MHNTQLGQQAASPQLMAVSYLAIAQSGDAVVLDAGNVKGGAESPKSGKESTFEYAQANPAILSRDRILPIFTDIHQAVDSITRFSVSIRGSVLHRIHMIQNSCYVI
jgi:hypothetical protein